MKELRPKFALTIFSVHYQLMSQEAHVRIDEGVRRGPRKQIDRRPKAALAQARDGKLISSYPPELRQQVTEAAHKDLASGLTTCQIGERFGVPGSTVRYWLLNDDKAEQARKAMVDQEIARTGEEMRAANDPLSLARAREEARYWMWIGERRDSARYGNRLAVESKQVIDPASLELASAAQELLKLFREKVVNPVQIEEKPLESVPGTDLSDA